MPARAEPAAAITRPLLDRVMRGYMLELDGIHGPDHWRRVRMNGLLLARRTHGADPVVVELFALLHDCRRIDDGHDPGHGPRAAALVHDLAPSGLLGLDGAAIELLARACHDHTNAETSPEPTIGCCWDADRLELSRLGIRPRAGLLSTAAARDPALQRAAWTRGYARARVPAARGWPAATG